MQPRDDVSNSCAPSRKGGPPEYFQTSDSGSQKRPALWRAVIRVLQARAGWLTQSGSSTVGIFRDGTPGRRTMQKGSMQCRPGPPVREDKVTGEVRSGRAGS